MSGQNSGEAAAPPRELSAGDEAALANIRVQDKAFFMPLAGVVLFMPPVIELFTKPLSLFGAPMIVIYMFLAWAGLILATWGLARRLRHEDFSVSGEGET